MDIPWGRGLILLLLCYFVLKGNRGGVDLGERGGGGGTGRSRGRGNCGGNVREKNKRLPCGCWQLNPGFLEEQPVTLPAEPSPPSLKKS